MAAAAPRFSVGSENAASTANAGKPNSKARSEPPIAMLASKLVPRTTTGTAMWRFSHWRRQRHSVSNANGQHGHKNHANSLSNAST